ncbi:MAG: hypothetical protein ABSF81_05695 [Bacteroidales bacterium]
MNKYYVYGHYDSQGNVFYIGKGTGERAGRIERHPTWTYYVEKYLLNNYIVKIIQDNLTEDEAFSMEAELILQYSKQLINWERPLIAKVTFSPFAEKKFTEVKDVRGVKDWESFHRYNKLLNENKKLISDSKILEITNIEGAIEGYRKVIKDLAEYSGYNEWENMDDCLLKRICLEMEKGEGIKGEVEAINRLTLCLCKVKRKDEAKIEALNYFSTYTYDCRTEAYVNIMKRVYKGEEIPLDILNTF